MSFMHQDDNSDRTLAHRVGRNAKLTLAQRMEIGSRVAAIVAADPDSGHRKWRHIAEDQHCSSGRALAEVLEGVAGLRQRVVYCGWLRRRVPRQQLHERANQMPTPHVAAAGPKDGMLVVRVALMVCGRGGSVAQQS